MIRFDLSDLRLVLAVERAGSVSGAAEAVHLAPSSAAAKLAALERGLDVMLFRRTSRGAVPTEAGRVFARHARTILSEASDLQASLERFARRKRAVLRVVSNENALRSFLPDGLGRFLEVHPEMTVEVDECASEQVVEEVASGLADAGVTAFAGECPSVTFEPYAVDRLVAVVPEGSALAALECVDFARLAAEPYVAIGPVSAMQDFLDERARDSGIRLVPRIRVANWEAAVALVARGAGVTVVPAFRLIEREGAVTVPLSDEWSVRTLRLCRRTRENEHEEEGLLDEFLRTLRESASRDEADRSAR